MFKHRVSGVMTEADRQAIMDAISTIKNRMPYLIALTTEERRKIFKMGDKSVAFVNKSLEVAIQNQGILTRDFDLEEMQRDVALYAQLQSMMMALTQLMEQIDGTMIQVGAEAYYAGRAVYKLTQMGGDGKALDELTELLGQRFTRKSKPSGVQGEKKARGEKKNESSDQSSEK